MELTRHGKALNNAHCALLFWLGHESTKLAERPVGW